jgi:carbonic anhydrase/acetyltransferase-like protein (isoleucine patch superfamily)
VEIAPGMLVMGAPAKARRPVSEDEQKRFRNGCMHYVEKAQIYKQESSS